MKSVNRATLVGNVGKDPEAHVTQSGTKIVRFSLATNRKVKDAERTDWHRITAFGKLADIIEQYVKKGDPVYIEGRIEYDSYQRDGVTIPTTDIVAQELVMLKEPVQTRTVHAAAPRDDEGDVPF